MKLKRMLNACTVKVLLFLLKHGEAKFSTLLREVAGSRSTLSIALRELIEEGLVDRTCEASSLGPGYTLTERGRKVAVLLDQINKVLTEAQRDKF